MKRAAIQTSLPVILVPVLLILGVPQKGLSSSGTEGASFLDIPVGAGPAALGGAYTAQAEDAYAPNWNPAALGFLPSTQIAGQHLSYLESIRYEYLSFVHPFKEKGGLGFSVQYLTSGDIPKTNLNGDTVGDFSNYYSAYNVAYGLNITKTLCLGTTAKVIRAKLNDTSATAFAADFGSYYRHNDNLALAAVVTNVGTKLKFVDQADSLPLAFRASANYWFNSQWNTAFEVVAPKTGLFSAHMGVEWNPLQVVSLRAGYRTDTTKELSAMAGMSVGLGLHLWGQEFAYAWLPMGDLGNTQYFSLVVRFWDLDIPHPRRNIIRYGPPPNRLVRLRDVQTATLAEPDFILPEIEGSSVAHGVEVPR